MKHILILLYIRMSFKKVASSELEIELQRVASTHGFCPNVISSNGLEFEMEMIDSPCLADKYGENVPEWIWKEISRILAVLYECEGIEYIDITPYNFIEKDKKIWIIDFGHAYYTKSPETPENWFLHEILDGYIGWNPDFK